MFEGLRKQCLHIIVEKVGQYFGLNSPAVCYGGSEASLTKNL